MLVALLLGLGWYQWAKNDLAAATRDTAARQTAEITTLRNANRELAITVERALRSVEAPAATAVAETSAAPVTPVDRAARTRALLDLIKGGELGQLTYPAPSQYKVSTKVEKLAEVLGLTPAETEALNAAANRVVADLLAGAQVNQGADAVTIEMKDSPAARARFGEMRETFLQVLGEDGHAVYEALGFRAALENSLNNLGLVGYTMTIQKVPGEAGKDSAYRYLREGTGPVTQVVGVTTGPRSPTFVAPVSDDEAARAEQERRKQQAQLAQARAAAVARGGPPAVGPLVADRATLANRLGALAPLIPPGF